MTVARRIPVDSDEARELREQETEHVAAPVHSPDCREGWLGEDDAGRPIPCFECRPHLRRLLA